MVWETRQNRLRNMIGTETNLCFQVCIGITTFKTYNCEKEFNLASRAYGLELELGMDAGLPQRNDLERLFQKGYFYKHPKSMRAQLLDTELLYTVAPYKLDNSDPEKSCAKTDFLKVATKYIPSIEKMHPHFSFNNQYFADSSDDRASIDFKFLVKPYDPANCHPRDLGIYRPITILGDDLILPSIS